jgi:glycerate dehydrogenase
MKITKLDESAYFPEHAVARLKTLGEFVKYDDRPNEEEALTRLRNTDIAIVEWTSIDRRMIEKISRLKHIVVALTGYEFVDVVAAREHGISVSNIPMYSRQSVAEHAFAILLALVRKIEEADHAAKMGKRDYYGPFLSMELYGKTLGIVGLGNIGSWMGKIGQGFGMTVIGHSRTPKNLPGIKDVSLEELLSISDVVMVSVDSNQTTLGLLDKTKLKFLKNTAYIICISPTGIVDEEVLANMLSNNELSGVGLDIAEEHSPLEKSKNAIITPGCAWYTQDALDRLAGIMVDNVESFIQGSPINLVN